LQSDFALFEVTIELTEAGDSHTEQVIRLVFSALALIKAHLATSPWVYSEMADLGKLSLQFGDALAPRDAVLAHATSMPLYAPRHIISAPHIFDHFDTEAIHHLLDLLTPERMCVFHASRVHADVADMREPWYDTPYSVECVAADLAHTWAKAEAHPDELRWPEPNPFIPKDFQLACDAAATLAPPKDDLRRLSFGEGPIGLGLKEHKNGQGVFVYQVHKGGQGEREGVKLGDRVMEVGGAETRTSGRDAVMLLIMSSARPVTIHFAPKGSDAAKACEPPAGVPPIAAAASAGAEASSVPPAAPQEPVPAVSPPVLIREDAAAHLWHKVDSTYRRPHTQIQVDIVAPAAYASPDAACLARLFFKLLSDELTEFAYSAELAGLSHSVRNAADGFCVGLSGYSHKLPVLLERIIQRIAHPTLDADRFAVQCELQRRTFTSFFLGSPAAMARYAASHLLEMTRWHMLEYVDFMASARCTLPALQEFARQALQRTHLRALCHGNTSAAEASAIIDAAATALGGHPLSRSQIPTPRLLQLPSGVEVHLRLHPSLYTEQEAAMLNANETNAAVELMLQAGPDEQPRTAVVELLASLLEGPAYDRLRTTEQLGYFVNLSARYTPPETPPETAYRHTTIARMAASRSLHDDHRMTVAFAVA